MMEPEEIKKHLEWLESERKKDKQELTDLNNQVTMVFDELNKLKIKNKSLETESKKNTQSFIRVSEFEEAIAKQRFEYLQQAGENEKKITSVDKKHEKMRKEDQDILIKRNIEIQNEVKGISDIRKVLHERVDEEHRISQKVDEFNKAIIEYRSVDEEIKRNLKLVEDNYRLESKRLTDLQMEASVLRKKLDDDRIGTESQKEFVHKLENRINELTSLEKNRKEDQMVFIESQSRLRVDQENQWKEWQAKIGQIESLTHGLQAQLSEIENTHHAMKKSLSQFDDINMKLDRRINEITEMNRLGEDRFRQEWVTFKADDQKRWTNYSLSQEEQEREGTRETTRLVEKFTKLEITVQELVDAIALVNEELERRIRSVLALSNELLNSFEQTMTRRK